MSGAQENSTWAPILEDELADRAWVALRSLGAGITAFTEPVTDLATFWSYVAPALGDDAEVHHDAALDRLGSVRVRDLRGPSLFRGLAGFGWTVMHCIDGFDELLQIIDTALIDGLAGSEWRGHYDLISGLTGIGVYFLERGDARLAVTGLDEILRHLARLAVRTTDGITWHTPPEHIPPGGDRYPSGWFNVGLAHGVPGVIGLLGKLPRSPQVDELRNGAIDWVLAQRTDNPSRSRFPAFAESPVGRSTRTAWCYGDLGVAVALWGACARTGELAKLPELEAVALAALNRSIDEARLFDGAFCHGTIGLAHIANRFFHATRRPEFREAAVRWYAATLELARPDQGVGGFSRWGGHGVEDEGWEASPNILDGAAGIGMALASALTPIEPAWDRLLLVDLPIAS